MNILEFLKKLFGKKEEVRNFGVLGIGEPLDTVYKQEDVVAKIAQAEFKPKSRLEWRTFFRQWQDGCSGCVAFTKAKIASILYFLKTGRKVKFTPGFDYTQRANRPGEGMYFSDIVKLASKGCLLYDLMPCEGFSEGQMNSLVVEQYHRDAADAFMFPDTWVTIDPKDFNAIASTIEKTGKGIMLWFTFGPGEFFSTQKPKYLNSDNPWAHSVTAVDAFTFEGKKYILIEDSAENNENLYQKLIDEEFLLKKCYLAAYPINFKFAIGTDGKPSYDGSIISLQKCLRYEGKFPENVAYVESNGPITQQAVKKFQAENSLEQTGFVGPKTKALLQEKYP